MKKMSLSEIVNYMQSELNSIEEKCDGYKEKMMNYRGSFRFALEQLKSIEKERSDNNG